MLFVFVIDTSASMARKFYLQSADGQSGKQGVSRLDAAKAAVEQFIRSRQKVLDQEANEQSNGEQTGDQYTKRRPSRSLTLFGLRKSEEEDVYLLIKSGTTPKLRDSSNQTRKEGRKDAFEHLENSIDPASHVVIGWQDPQSQFTHALRQLQVETAGSMRTAIAHAFGLLALARLGVGIDHYGRGWLPSKSGRTFLPGVVVVLSDSHFNRSRHEDDSTSSAFESFFSQYLTSKKMNIVDQMSRYLDRHSSCITAQKPCLDGELSLGSDQLQDFIDSSHSTAYLSDADKNSLKQGINLSKCCHRWDQRLYSILMVDDEPTKNGEYPDVNVPWNKSENLSLCSLSRATGGYFHIANSMTAACKVLSKIATKFSAKIQFGPLVSFVMKESGKEKQHILRKQLYARYPGSSYWPVPEEFDDRTGEVSRESSHPLLEVDTEENKLQCSAEVIRVVIRDLQLPFDAYDLQRSSLTDAIVDTYTTKQRESNSDCSTLWTVKLPASKKQTTDPFGIICVSEDPIIRHKTRDKQGQGLTVMLLMLPWNFPWLFSLLWRIVRPYQQLPTELDHQYIRSIVDREDLPMGWIESFREYVSSLPIYCRKFLITGLRKFGLEKYIDSPKRAAYKHVFTAAESYLRTAGLEQKQLQENDSAAEMESSDISSVGSKSSRSSSLQQIEAVHPFTKYYFSGAGIGRIHPSKRARDGEKKNLLRPARSQEQEDTLHMVPINSMSNYIPKLAAKQRLRDPVNLDDNATTELERGWIHFGNPYCRLKERQSKQASVDIGQAEEMENVDKSIDAEAKTEAAFLFSSDATDSGKFDTEEAESQLNITYRQEGTPRSIQSTSTNEHIDMLEDIRKDGILRRNIARRISEFSRHQHPRKKYRAVCRTLHRDKIPKKYLRIFARRSSGLVQSQEI